MAARTIEIPNTGIIVAVDSVLKAGTITSNLHSGDTPEYEEYNAAIDGLEALVLAHACSGIDVSAPAYVEGIITAIDAINNNF